MPNLNGFQHLIGYLDKARQATLLDCVRTIVADSPLYVPTMPRSGKPFSVRMTNCGSLGWVSDKDGGYRYQRLHPETGRPWPAMPAPILAIWREVAHYEAAPEACLINHYAAGTKLGSHVDQDEDDKAAPVVSISLGCDAVFHVGGTRRTDAKVRMVLKSGDVVVLGGAARLAFHGIDKVTGGSSALLEEGGRINLTLRRVTRPA